MPPRKNPDLTDAARAALPADVVIDEDTGTVRYPDAPEPTPEPDEAPPPPPARTGDPLPVDADPEPTRDAGVDLVEDDWTPDNTLGAEPEVGQFAGLGTTHASRNGYECTVDPDTGLVTAVVASDVPVYGVVSPDVEPGAPLAPGVSPEPPRDATGAPAPDDSDDTHGAG